MDQVISPPRESVAVKFATTPLVFSSTPTNRGPSITTGSLSSSSTVTVTSSETFCVPWLAVSVT